MSQCAIALFVLLLIAPLACGAVYSSAVLYPMPVPAGFARVDPNAVTADAAAGSGTLTGTSAPPHALLWSAPGVVADLNPTNLGDISRSQIYGISGSQQVGSMVGNATGGYGHAVIWNGSADSAVDLEPTNLTGFFGSSLHATDGAHQVGFGLFGTSTSWVHHALLFSGTANSAVDLNPTKLGGPLDSVALGVGGGQEVGEYSSSTSPLHAILWNGTADSAVDLHPSDPSLTFSAAIATNGTQQVGMARASGGDVQAFLWYGTADSAVNLNPTTLPGIDASIAVATNGQQQVGHGFNAALNANADHALVWSGSADSVVDLHAALPVDGAWDFSDAYSIDASGDIFGVASGTYNDVTGYYAVEWTPVPEPAETALMALGSIAMLRRRRR